jgi:hypothetical protein
MPRQNPTADAVVHAARNEAPAPERFSRFLSVLFVALLAAGVFTLWAGDSRAEPNAKTPEAPSRLSSRTPTRTASAKVWTLDPTASGFQWQPPNGGAPVCKFAGVSLVDDLNLTRAGQDTNVVPNKYPTWAAWAQAQSNRLRSWGFNAAGQYSSRYETPANFPSGGVPAEVTVQVSGHATRDDGSYFHCKSLNWNYGTMVCGSSFYNDKGNGGGQADAFDASCDNGAGIAGAYLADLGTGGNSNLYNPSTGYPKIGNVQLVTTEEGDTMFGLDNQYSHEDLAYDIAAQSPMQTVSPNGYAYPNKTLDAKIAMRDRLAYIYGCTNGGNVGTPIAAGDDIHPSSAYCGSTEAASSLSALNAAWGTNYTTWSTSDSGGETGIKNGTYASYGTGTGLLDENGSHILASAYRSNCGLNGFDGSIPSASWSSTAQIEIDLHNFIIYFATTYARNLSAAWAQSSANPHPPIFVPLYDGPSYVYTAIAPYFNGFWVNPTAGSATGAMNLSDLQRIIGAASVSGGKTMPLIIADYSNANPDSPWSANPPPYGEGPHATVQGDRGNAMVSWWSSAIHQQDINGKYVVVGLEHWAFYDQANEGSNLGLVTCDHDNPYDGSADTANGEAANYGDAITPLSDFLNAGICDP